MAVAQLTRFVVRLPSSTITGPAPVPFNVSTTWNSTRSVSRLGAALAKTTTLAALTSVAGVGIGSMRLHVAPARAVAMTSKHASAIGVAACMQVVDPKTAT